MGTRNGTTENHRESEALLEHTLAAYRVHDAEALGALGLTTACYVRPWRRPVETPNWNRSCA